MKKAKTRKEYEEQKILEICNKWLPDLIINALKITTVINFYNILFKKYGKDDKTNN